ncbi:arginine succinyltransferase [Alteromonas sp. 38]|uniref:arginine N-succinyltransferase n=1 Tax=Alteromonas TaxID=226 RepID=UPI0012EF40F6|nr:MULTISPECIES: arginine N-succinyltransferase [Alteromonas]CAD5253495.1 arginine succinyltransferase [Alteromonas sp. 154]VXB08729.1 arginine succinyltransferase [Alteromonas sp. 38]
MNIIRPIKQADYKALYDIAVESGIGFTSLPVNDDLLHRKVDQAQEAFTKANVTQPGDESYLFVMEDTTTGEVVGTSGIEAAVGIDDAFYHYHLSKVVHASRELNIHNTVEILTFCNDYTGVTEICTLFLREQARGGINGRFLSKVRFLFMMEHRERFSETIIAEMRGVSDEEGRSPFWEWLETHFFSMDFPTADYLTGIGNKVFIAELMPKYPIYVNLLSKEAQAVIGQVHEKTRPALQLLEGEGFSCRGYVDIFDAGPTVEANLSHIRTAQSSLKMPIVIDDAAAAQGQTHYIINTSVADFRAVATEIGVNEEQNIAVLSRQAAAALNVQEGDHVRLAPVKFRD